MTHHFWLKPVFWVIYEIVSVCFSQKFIFMFALKKLKHLNLPIGANAKMGFCFYLLTLSRSYELSLKVYSLLYQAASLTNIFFSTALTNNNINKVSALWIWNNTLFTLLNEWKQDFNKYGQHPQVFPQDATSKCFYGH